MMTMVQAINAQGELLSLPLDDISNGFSVEDIDGLDPVKATIVSSSFATLDGTQYQSSKREPRDLKLTIGLEPDWASTTVRDLRHRLYSFFMPKSEVHLRFHDSSGLIVDISGRVETCAAPMFVQEPKMEVNVVCFKPDFIDLTPVIFSGNTVSTTTMSEIDYLGTVESGIIFRLYPNRALTEFTIYHQPPDGNLRTLDFATALASGQVLTITTIPGSKGAILNTSGVNTSVLYGISPQSNWIEFQPGVNKIRAYATGAAIPIQIEYTHKYGGL